MPLSPKSFKALKTAVQWNPHGAYELLTILLEYPGLVKYKNDRYGPLGLIISATIPRDQIVPGLTIPRKSKPFPEEILPSCELFAEEWRARKFSKTELTEAIEGLLSEFGKLDDLKGNPVT